MKTRLLTAALLGFLFTVPALAAKDNPFGLDLDKHPSEYGCSQSQNDKYWYSCKKLPKPHPEFEAYGVKYADGVGICYVNAIGKTIENDSYGLTTRGRVDAIVKQLKPKYGAETDKIALLLPGSIWDDPDDWMMAVRREERFYVYTWQPKDGFNPVGEVDKVFVAARAAASDAGFVKLEFSFKRNPKCDAVIEKAGQDAF